MPRFLIEIPHEAKVAECARAAETFIPPAFRPQAKIVQLNTFTLAQLEDLQRHHST